VNFILFIGIIHDGTLISAILQVAHAGWRTPVTRMAELITIVAISVGALVPIIDLEHTDRVWYLIAYGHFIIFIVGWLLYYLLPNWESYLPPSAVNSRFTLMRDRLLHRLDQFVPEYTHVPDIIPGQGIDKNHPAAYRLGNNLDTLRIELGFGKDHLYALFPGLSD